MTADTVQGITTGKEMTDLILGVNGLVSMQERC